MRAAAQSRIASWSVSMTVSAIQYLLAVARTPERKRGSAAASVSKHVAYLNAILCLGARLRNEPQRGSGFLDTGLFISLLNPAIALTLAAAFMLLWLYRRQRSLSSGAGRGLCRLGDGLPAAIFRCCRRASGDQAFVGHFVHPLRFLPFGRHRDALRAAGPLEGARRFRRSAGSPPSHGSCSSSLT